MSKTRMVYASSYLILAFLLSNGTHVGADAVSNTLIYQSIGTVYRTADTIDQYGQQNIDPYVRFQNVVDGRTDLNGPFTLGKFVVSIPTPEAGKEYNDARFEIQLDFSQPGTIGSGSESAFVIGHLDGKLGGGAEPTLRATVDGIVGFNSMDTPQLPTDGLFFPIGGLSVLSLDLAVNPNGGEFTVMAEVHPIPEPTTCASLILMVGGLIYQKTRRRATEALPARSR